jgi:hypothetical protein
MDAYHENRVALPSTFQSKKESEKDARELKVNEVFDTKITSFYIPTSLFPRVFPSSVARLFPSSLRAN